MLAIISVWPKLNELPNALSVTALNAVPKSDPRSWSRIAKMISVAVAAARTRRMLPSVMPRGGRRLGGLLLGDLRAPPGRARHRQRDVVDRALVARGLVGHLAAEEDDDAIRELEQLVQVDRDEHDRLALTAVLEQALVHVLGSAHVHALRGVGGDQHAVLARHLARDHDLLLVAARQREDGQVGIRRAHVVLLEQPPRAALDRL